MKRTEMEDKNCPSLPNPDNHRPVNLHTPPPSSSILDVRLRRHLLLVEEANVCSGEVICC